MRWFRFRTSVVVPVLTLVLAAAGSVVAASQSTDERALQPTRQQADQAIERRVNNLLSKMTLEEKLEQIQLLPDFLVTDQEVRDGLGSVLSVTDPKRIHELQRMAVEESRLHIPMMFAFDTIHGFRTIFPIPLGAGASFDPKMASDDHTYGARESAAVGLKQTYAPMVDVSHEPRWGRISEAAGEDPYLNSVMAAARVKAIQGTDYSAPDKLVASPKHFAAYGQPESGRDYNTTDMSEQRLWNFYLPPFKAAVDAGADTAMCSFNAISGVPGCGNDHTLNQILKGEWGFDGFVESDWTAVKEMRACPPVKPDSGECGHGVAADGPAAAALALNSGVDSEMTSTLIRDYGAQLLSEGRISMRRIDDAVRRILRVKFRAGLFEHPYAPVDPDKAEAEMLKPDAVAAARNAASRSMVLLQNKGDVLPLDPSKKTAVIGPLAKDPHDMLGPWWGAGRGRPAQRPPAGARGRGRRRPRPARGMVPGGAGGPRRRRRGVRQGRPGREAAGGGPAPARPGADLLQPRADRPALQSRPEVQLAPPRHPELLAAVHVRLRAQLHDLRGLGLAPELLERVEEGQPRSLGDGEEHRQPQG